MINAKIVRTGLTHLMTKSAIRASMHQTTSLEAHKYYRRLCPRFCSRMDTRGHPRCERPKVALPAVIEKAQLCNIHMPRLSELALGQRRADEITPKCPENPRANELAKRAAEVRPMLASIAYNARSVKRPAHEQLQPSDTV